ncbi:MAG: hypothetical protein HY340_02115 [Candidatus Kerfeldbacteria bacterium]|nr:hypothetical protein [Candidatus Kerfeldbacteria bacterium]
MIRTLSHICVFLTGFFALSNGFLVLFSHKFPQMPETQHLLWALTAGSASSALIYGLIHRGRFDN